MKGKHISDLNPRKSNLPKAGIDNPHVSGVQSQEAAWYHLHQGTIYQAENRFQRALFHYAEALRLQPQLADVFYYRSFIYAKQGHMELSLMDLTRAVTYRPDPKVYSVLLFGLMYQPLLPWAQAYHYFEQWEQQWAAPLREPFLSYPNLLDPDKRLRIGYISADFRYHVVIHLFAALFACHNPVAYEVFVYANQQTEDRVTAWFKEKSDHWRNIVDLSDEQLCTLIRADQIDILVDLSGHTAGNRIYALARQPAPIQVSGPGYLGPTGLKTMQWRFTDPWMQPPNSDIWSSETLIFLDSIMHFIPEQAPYFSLKLSHPPCLERGFPVLGCSNNPIKLNAFMAEIWATILQQSPTACLYFKYHGFDEHTVQARWRDFFAQRGIQSERLWFEGHTGQIPHLAFYQVVDVVLDPFPYSGGLTTLEALWSGVPVVTMAGQEWFGCHTSESILNTLGCTDWVAQTPTAYVDGVCTLLDNPEQLMWYRTHLRERLQQSVLCDAPNFARQVENAYRYMWTEWCQ